MSRFPAPVDQKALLEKLRLQEKTVALRLRELEGLIRRFEDSDRPAYENWVRLEFGPLLKDLEELHAEIAQKRSLARRIQTLVDSEGLHPREALHVAQAKNSPEEDEPAEDRSGSESSEERGGARAPGGWDPEELKARKQAKREAKRKARKEQKKAERLQARPESPAGTGLRARLVSLYRALARRLHPDSAHFAREIPPVQARSLWHEVQAAYESSDLERLAAIATWLGNEEGAGNQEGELPGSSFSERLDRIRGLERTCRKQERRIEQLRTDPAWEFGLRKGGVPRKIRQRVAREIDQEFANAQELMEALNDLIESIGPPRAPRARQR